MTINSFLGWNFSSQVIQFLPILSNIRHAKTLRREPNRHVHSHRHTSIHKHTDRQTVNTSSLNFYRPDALPDALPTESKLWRHTSIYWQRHKKYTHDSLHFTVAIAHNKNYWYSDKLAGSYVTGVWCWRIQVPRVGQGQPSVPPYPFTSPSFHLLLFTFSLSCSLYLFSYLFINSLSTTVVPLHFQARGRRKRPNQSLVFWGSFCVICIF